MCIIQLLIMAVLSSINGKPGKRGGVVLTFRDLIETLHVGEILYPGHKQAQKHITSITARLSFKNKEDIEYLLPSLHASWSIKFTLHALFSPTKILAVKPQTVINQHRFLWCWHNESHEQK